MGRSRSEPPGVPQTIQIDGEIVNGTPTWVFNGKPAVNVPVKPKDTVIWRVVAGTHGVVFIPSAGGVGLAMAFSNDQLVPSQNPQTPIFTAAAGSPVRFRLVMPSTSTSNGRIPPVVFDIHGHGWPEESFAEEGEVIGGWRTNPFAVGVRTPPMNWRSQYLGSQQIAVYEAFNFVIDHAGGDFGRPWRLSLRGLPAVQLHGNVGAFPGPGRPSDRHRLEGRGQQSYSLGSPRSLEQEPGEALHDLRSLRQGGQWRRDDRRYEMDLHGRSTPGR